MSYSLIRILSPAKSLVGIYHTYPLSGPEIERRPYMYALFTLLAGACQSAMASLNGMLTDHIGMFGMSFCVHAIGGILLILYMKAGMPWYLYSAGFFGIFLVVSSSYCIGVLGVSFMTCISVTGQLVISAVIDHFGWFGVPKIPFNRKRLPCFILILAGLIILNLS